jgi:hypothetical protein
MTTYNLLSTLREYRKTQDSGLYALTRLGNANGGDTVFVRCGMNNTNPAPNYGANYRGYLVYNTSDIGSLNILSATISLTILLKFNGLGLSDFNAGMGLVRPLIVNASNQTSKYNLNNIDLTLMSNAISFSQISDVGVPTILTLNSDGIANINKNGLSAFILMLNLDRNGGDPGWIALTQTVHTFEQVVLNVVTGPGYQSYALGSGKKLFRLQKNIQSFNVTDLL